MIPFAAHWARQPHENHHHHQQQQEGGSTNNTIGLLGSAASWQISSSSDHIQQQQGDWHLQHHIEAAIKAQQPAAWGDQPGITSGWDNPMILATAQSHHRHNGTQEHHYHPGLHLVQEGRQQQQEAAANNNNIILQAEPLTAAASSQLSRHYEAFLASNPALSSLPTASSSVSSSTIWPAALLSSTEGGLRSGDHHEGPVAGNSGGSYNGFHSINGLVNGVVGGALHGSCSNGHGSSSSAATGGGGSLSLYDASGHGSSGVSNSTTTNNTTASRLYDASSGHGGSSANTASPSTTSSEQDAAARLVNLLGLGASLGDQRSGLAQGLMAVAKGTPLSSSTDNHHHHHQHHLPDQFSTRIGLNLGGRTYFSASDELQLQADQADHGGHSGFIMQLGGYGGRFSAGAGGKRGFSMIRHGVPGLVHTPAPSCQADGCKADLALAKPYHRRHKVCASHSKAPSVSIAGQTQRFCQQCSRFHGLLEFDDVKRSCRKRLADHNRRRRKPQPTPLTTSNISPSSPSAAPAAASTAPMAANNNTSTAPAVAEHADDHAKLTISGPDDDDEDDDKATVTTDLQGGRSCKDEKQEEEEEEQWPMLPSTSLPLASAGVCVDPQVNDHPTLRHVAAPQPQDGGSGPRLSLTSTEEPPGGSPRAGTRGASWSPEWLRRGSSAQEDGDIMDVVSRSPPTKEGNDKPLGLGTTYTYNNNMKSFGLQELRFSQNRAASLGPWQQHDIIG